MRSQSPTPLLWVLAAALAVWASGFTSMINSDLWFHLAAGREIVEERVLPRVDDWSFTAAGQPWHNHEWLSGLFFHLWSRLFGVQSLVYWQWGVLLATFLLFFHVLQRLAESRLAAWLLLLFTLAVAAPFFDIRPHLWSLLGFAVVVQQTLLRPAPSRFLPLVFLVWINLHGGAVFGLMALAIGLAAGLMAPSSGDPAPTPEQNVDRPWTLGRTFRPALPSIGLWLACLGATLVNPFGWNAWIYPLKLALASQSPSRSTLTEWLPPFVPGGIRSPLYPAAIGFLVVAALALVAAGGLRRRRRVALAVLVLAGLTLAMSLQSRRFIPLFAMSQAMAAAVAFGALREDRAVSGHRRKGRGASRAPHGFPAATTEGARFRNTLDLAAAALAVAVGLVRLAPHPLGPPAFAVSTRLDTLPVAALDFATAEGLAGEVFTQLLWGGYVRYRTTDLLVFMDPRSETVYPEAVQRRYFSVHFGRPGWRDIVDSSSAEYFLWPVNKRTGRGMIDELLASGAWREIYRDGVAALLERDASARPAATVATILRPPA